MKMKVSYDTLDEWDSDCCRWHQAIAESLLIEALIN